MKDRKVQRLELLLDEKLGQSFLGEGPSGTPGGPLDSKEVLPLTITL